MEWIEVKTLLSKNKRPEEWFGFDYNLNLYKGCCHGCIYCDSRSQCYRIDHFDVVRGKKDTALILEKELRHKRKKGIIGMGAMSDPYNPFEKEARLTRGALTLIERYGFGVGITTKSDLILEDLEHLKKIHENMTAVVNFTITSASDECSLKIEPHISVSSKRFEAVRRCKEAGLICGIIMNPVLPFITDSKENILKMIDMADQCHVDYIMTYMGVTLRQNQRDYYYKKLDELYPGLSYQYQRIYGNRYHCESLKWRENYEILKKECQKRKILYQMEDIVDLITSHKKEMSQLSLFD